MKALHEYILMVLLVSCNCFKPGDENLKLYKKPWWPHSIGGGRPNHAITLVVSLSVSICFMDNEAFLRNLKSSIFKALNMSLNLPLSSLRSEKVSLNFVQSNLLFPIVENWRLFAWRRGALVPLFYAKSITRDSITFTSHRRCRWYRQYS